MSADDSYLYNRQAARIYQGVIVAFTVAPIFVLTFLFHGALRVVFIVAAVAMIVAGVHRAFRISLRVDNKNVTVRNYWRTYNFAWSDVAAIGTAGVMLRPALGFVLADNRVRSAQITQDSRRARDDVRQGLRAFAPASVRFVPELRRSVKAARCPHCGKTLLAPDFDKSGTRHCWGCGVDVPDPTELGVPGS